MLKKYFKSRLDYIRAIVILMALLLIFRLADLQIVQGAYYKNRAENIRTRIISVDAPRGLIVDKFGRTMADNKLSFSANIVKSDLPKENINEIALTVINIIERNGDTYKDEIPILINPIRFTYAEDELNWKQKYNIPLEATAKEAFAKIRQDNNISADITDAEAYNTLTKEFGIELPFDSEIEQYSYKKDELRWKKNHNYDEGETAEEIFARLIERYEIPSVRNSEQNGYTDAEIKKILAVRYLLGQNVYKAYEPVEIAADISEQTRAQLEESKIFLPGIEITQKPIRQYKNNESAAHILGYMGKIGDELETLGDKGYTSQDIIGKSGIEATMEEYLKGQDGSKQIEIDKNYVMIDTVNEVDPIPGDNVFLTIDYKLQRIAEDSLKQTIETIQKGDATAGINSYPEATSGAAIAVDVNSGRVLAMASYPSYDPNLFATGISTKDWKALQPETNDQYAAKPLINNAVTTALPPGSIYKMIVGVAGLKNGTINPTELVFDKGRFEIGGGYAPSCAIWKTLGRGHGNVNLVAAIQKSCNYYFFEMSSRMGGEPIEDYAKQFGLSDKTGIELLGEATGVVSGPTYKKQLYERRLNYHLKYKLSIENEQLRKTICNFIYEDKEISKIKEELLELGIDKSAIYDIVQYIRESKWRLYDTVQASIGQGFNTATPLQMACYTAALVNGGKGYKPYLVDKIVGYDGTVKLEKSPEVVHEVDMDSSTTEWIKKGMVGTNTEGGTAYREFLGSTITSGGKTGTAQVDEISNHAWYVGFAPVDKPEIAVAVVVVKGGHGNYLATVARAIMEGYLTAEEIRDNITPANDMIK